jgi:hypothetical protein
VDQEEECEWYSEEEKKENKEDVEVAQEKEEVKKEKIKNGVDVGSGQGWSEKYGDELGVRN